ncbi:helix-turn-helix domain-containing protein [Vibrio pectenicida]|uniref:AraC family transcriptional regulator n=1 Tax=Vibrio pectenicida TaxID=62763 RepID=UPI003B9CCC7C
MQTRVFHQEHNSVLENSLTIRAYTHQRLGHTHDYHQLVLPILGVIDIELEGYKGSVSVGECVIIAAGIGHHFRAHESSRFVVADLDELPANIFDMESSIFPISAPLLSYLSFVESQLQHRVSDHIEKSMVSMFMQLICEQTVDKRIDHRIRTVLQVIDSGLDADISIDSLAAVACLSSTQFKKLFKRSTGLSVMQYVTQQRMEKAKALLTHTDTPVQLIAEKVGYADVSAFSRRFSLSFGLSPRELRR